MKYELHSLRLVQNLASLFDVNVKSKFSDVTVQVRDRCFYVHKLILQLNSDYFANLSYSNGTETLNNIDPDRFYDILQFIYRGEIQLSDESVESVLSTADVLRMNDLKQICFRYMDANLTVENTLRYWRLGAKYEQTALIQKCQMQIKTNWTKFDSCISLIHSTEEMSWFLDAGELNMSNEVEVCEMLIKWLKRQNESGKDIPHSNELLTLIRWSSIGIDYLKTSLLNNAVLTSNASSRMFLGKVLTYLLSGVQFPGLKTFHRSATGLENCLFVVGLDSNDEKAVSNNVYRISLQRPNRTRLLGGIPAEMFVESASCSIGNAVFLTGVGSARQDQLWRWELLSGWTRCADMIEDRRRHCVVMVDSILFVLGGFNGSTNTVLRSIDSYSALANKWKSVGELTHAVENAACVMYKNSIYVFGGFESNGRPSDFVQVYNIASNCCVVRRTPMPRASSLMRALMWETSVILLKRDACYIYNLETDSWRERNQFRTNVMHFAAVPDNERIYVAGGGVSSCSSSNGENKWAETDEVKSVSVFDLVNDKPAAWEHHAKLACPSSIHSYCLLTMPSLAEDFNSLIPRKRQR